MTDFLSRTIQELVDARLVDLDHFILTPPPLLLCDSRPIVRPRTAPLSWPPNPDEEDGSVQWFAVKPDES